MGKKQIDPAHKLDLDYSSEPLVARFTALRFGREQDLIFRYRLDPLFKTWKETPNGNSSFRRSRRKVTGWKWKPGIWPAGGAIAPAAFEFRVLAPWWRTWWFFGGCTLLGGLLAGFFLWRRNVHQETIRRALENAVAERTRELSHQYRHDVLTGLPNRLLFGERLNEELLPGEACGIRGSRCCLWIWTGSNVSTIRGGTRPGISSCNRSPNVFVPHCVSRKRSRVLAATNLSF